MLTSVMSTHRLVRMRRTATLTSLASTDTVARTLMRSAAARKRGNSPPTKGTRETVVTVDEQTGLVRNPGLRHRGRDQRRVAHRPLGGRLERHRVHIQATVDAF